ncbi:Baculoviral IAP repeat-containing protein 2 [Mactra antiquata]
MSTYYRLRQSTVHVLRTNIPGRMKMKTIAIILVILCEILTTVLVVCILLTVRIKVYMEYKLRGVIIARDCRKKQKHSKESKNLMSGEQLNEVMKSVNGKLPYEDDLDCDTLLSREYLNDAMNSINEELPYADDRDCESLVSGELPNEVMNSVQENHNIIEEKECETLASGGELNKRMNGEMENKLLTDGQHCWDNIEPKAVDVSSNSLSDDWGQVDGKGCSFACKHVPDTVGQKADDAPQNGSFLDERGQDGEKEINTPISQKILRKAIHKLELRKLFDKGKYQVTAKQLTDVLTYQKRYGIFSYTVFPLSAQFDRMNHEKNRFSTFENYEGSGISLRLAKNGFYHDHGNGPSFTVCYCCNFDCSDWQRHSNIEQRHRGLNPNCPLLNDASDNVPWLLDNGRNGTIVDGDIGGLWQYRESTVIEDGPVVDLSQNIVSLGRRSARPAIIRNPNRRPDWTGQYGVNNRPVEAVNATVVQPTGDVPVSSRGGQMEILNVEGNSNRRQGWRDYHDVLNPLVEAVNATVVQPTGDVPVSSRGGQMEILNVEGNSNRRQGWRDYHDVLNPLGLIELQENRCHLCKKQPGRAVCRHLTVCEECQTTGFTCPKC